MEQKTINQNKLQTLLCIIALTLGVLVSAVLFRMPPVHAEESVSCFVTSNSGTYDIHGQYTDSKNNICEYDYHCVLDDTSRYYGLVKIPSMSEDIKFNTYFLASYVIGSNEQARAYHNYNEYPHYFTEHGDYHSNLKYYNCQGLHHYYSSIGTSAYELTSHGSAGLNFGDKASDKITNDSYVHDISFDYFPLPVFDSYESMTNYCKTGDKSGVVSEPQVPDLTDESYTYTGFSINGKTARWTGTTERSHLKDQEVEEYTRITYGFATSEDQALDADNFIEYDQDFAVGEKQMTIPWSEIESNKKDGEFIRQVNFIPCYRVPGAFYLGKGVKVFYKSDGSIDKIEYAQKQTDLNTGNMIFDSSIGYLQNVIYTEEKTHDGKGRQASFKWSTSKALPDDAQVEIVAQNFYIEWFNKKTEENFIYKEYGEDCIYKNGSFSFNANTPVWTWLNEKEIDPFSVKTQSYGTKEYYLRIVTYNEKDSMYHYGGWVRVNVKSKDATNMPTTDVETGGFDDDSGLWNKDSDSDDSYHYSTDDKGDLTGNISVSDWEDLNINSFTWMYRNLQSMVQSLGQLPTMVSTIFGFLPNQVITALSVLLIAVVLMRFLGR